MNDDVPRGGSAAAPERPDFETVYREGAAYVAGTLRCLGVPAQDCEDAMHDVFLIVRRRLHEYEPRGRLNAWLAAIARNVALGYRRRRAHGPVLVESPGEVGEKLEATMKHQRQDDAETRAIARELFLRLLDDIEDDRRIVFVMHDVQDLSIAEIARALQIPEGTASTRLRLARQDFEAACKRLAARERGNGVLLGALAPAALLGAGRTMPPLPGDVYDRVLARLRAAPGSPSPGADPGRAVPRDTPASAAKDGAAAAPSSAAAAIRGVLVLAAGIAIGALWSPLQRSYPAPRPPSPVAVSSQPEEAVSAAPVAAVPASPAVPPAARSSTAPDAQEDEATERLLMAKAADALRAGDAALALAAVEEHAQRFRGGGRLAETRETYWIAALRRAGRVVEANERVERFARTYPKSARLDELRAAADGGAGPR